MNPRRILALDYGSKRVGLAVSDPLGWTAQPLPFLTYKSWSDLVARLRRLIEEKSIERIIVGLPKSPDGGLGAQAAQCEQFAERLRREFERPVELVDETFTTREAEEILIRELDLSREKRKKLVDSLSACLLLRDYMKRQEGENPT